MDNTEKIIELLEKIDGRFAHMVELLEKIENNTNVPFSIRGPNTINRQDKVTQVYAPRTPEDAKAR